MVSLVAWLVYPARRHTTHHDYCDCRVEYVECVSSIGCRNRERRAETYI